MARKKKETAEEFIVLEEAEEIITTKLQPKPFQPNPLLVPLSIVLAGILVAGAIVYNGRIGSVATTTQATGSSSTQIAPTQASQLEPDYVSFAKSLNLDVNKFKECTSKDTYANQIQASVDEGNKVGVSGTPTVVIGRIDHSSNTLTGTEISGALPYDTFKTVLDGYMQSSNPSFNGLQGISTTQVSVSIDKGFYEGNKNANVGFLEFSDYECPYCKQLFDGTLPQLRSNYVDKGTVYHIFKDFPLTSIHPYALPGAEAARCAGDQGKYWQMHDLIYKNQT